MVRTHGEARQGFFGHEYWESRNVRESNCLCLNSAAYRMTTPPVQYGHRQVDRPSGSPGTESIRAEVDDKLCYHFCSRHKKRIRSLIWQWIYPAVYTPDETRFQ